MYNKVCNSNVMISMLQKGNVMTTLSKLLRYVLYQSFEETCILRTCSAVPPNALKLTPPFHSQSVSRAY